MQIGNRLLRFVRPMERATAVHQAIAALPIAEVREITDERPTLVLSPHPDDESLGCGGFIAAACALNQEVFVAVLTDGTGSHAQSRTYSPEQLRDLREVETAHAVQVLGLGADHLSFFRYRDAFAPLKGPELAAAAGRLTDFMLARSVGTILATWKHDPHGDHLSAHRIAALAAHSTGARHLSYPIWGWTLSESTWLPRATLRGMRLDVTQQLPIKRRAIECHRSQLGDVIRDDPMAFRLPEQLLRICDRPFEAYLHNDI